jgi:chromosomal replication initiator protein
MSLELAEEVLQQYVDPEPDRTHPERILTAVAERWGVRTEALCGSSRTRSIAVPRQVAMYLTRQLTELSLVEVGRLFGGRDHTTVMYACQRVGEMLRDEPEFSERVNALIVTLASG